MTNKTQNFAMQTHFSTCENKVIMEGASLLQDFLMDIINNAFNNDVELKYEAANVLRQLGYKTEDK